MSIVQHRHLPRKLLVRARCRQDLENFVRLLDEIGGKEHPVQDTPDADYGYRTVACQRAVARALARLAAEIDYPNFKQAAHGDRARDSAYMRVWRAMAEFQADKEEGQRPGPLEWPQ